MLLRIERKVCQQNIARCVGFMDFLVRSAPVRMYFGYNSAVRRYDLLAASPLSHTQQRSRLCLGKGP